MPLWEGILASFCAGIGVSLINRFGLSQIPTPCEKARVAEAAAHRDDDTSSSDDSGERAAATSALGDTHTDVQCHHGGGDG